MRRAKATSGSSFLSIYHLRLLGDRYLSITLLPGLYQSMKKLLSRRLKLVVPVSRASDFDFLFAGCQAFVRLIDELIKWHAHRLLILELGLVLFVVELGCYTL